MRTIFFILAVLLTLSANAQSYTPDQIRSAIRQAGGPEKFMAEMARLGSTTSGRMIDDQIELLSVQSLDKVIVYFNRLANFRKVDIADSGLLRKRIAKRNAPSVCTAPVSGIMIREYGAEYKYIVYAKDREYLFEYSFNRKTCAPEYVW